MIFKPYLICKSCGKWTDDGNGLMTELLTAYVLNAQIKQLS